jgi:hypothetical protein
VETQLPAIETLDAFLAGGQSAASLLGWEVVLHENSAHVGFVAEVLSSAGGEMVLEVTGQTDAAPSDAADPFVDMLASLGTGVGDEGGSSALLAGGSVAPESVLLRVTCSGRGYDWHVFIPLAQPLVPQLERGKRRLRVTPPPGLIELGERPALLAWLREQLPALLHRSRLPSCAELERAGRADVAN